MRSCIIETTKENESIIRRHLPEGIHVVSVNEPFDRINIELRLEGDGLPSWCEKGYVGYYARAMLDVLADGTTRIIPGAGMPLHQIHPDVKE